jgi:hypothetical protein
MVNTVPCTLLQTPWFGQPPGQDAVLHAVLERK